MSQRLATAVEELRAEETRIQANLNELRRQVKSGETELNRIRRALSVLAEKPPGKSANRKPAATRHEVIVAIAEILGSNGSVAETELQGLVANKLVSDGKSKMGLALRLKEALNDARFTRDTNGRVTESPSQISAEVKR